MAIVKTEAITLKTFDYRETSLIAHFFTKEYGRINGILKGIRGDPKKFASTLEPFSCNQIIFYQKRNSDLHLVSQCDLLDNFKNIRANLDSVVYASHIVELINRLMPHEEKNENVYRLLMHALKQIDAGQNPENVTRIFVIKLLKLIGFKPRLDGCISCDRDVINSAFFNVKRGGLLCAKCNDHTSHYSRSILKGTIASILHLEHSPWQEALRLGLNTKIKEELTNILQSFMEFHLEIRPKTDRILKTLNKY